MQHVTACCMIQICMHARIARGRAMWIGSSSGSPQRRNHGDCFFAVYCTEMYEMFVSHNAYMHVRAQYATPRNHPIQQWPADVRSATVGISVHGDEGQGKRDRSVLVISWSAVGISGKTFHCRFPFAATRLRSTYVHANLHLFNLCNTAAAR